MPLPDSLVTNAKLWQVVAGIEGEYIYHYAVNQWYSSKLNKIFSFILHCFRSHAIIKHFQQLLCTNLLANRFKLCGTHFRAFEYQTRKVSSWCVEIIHRAVASV